MDLNTALALSLPLGVGIAAFGSALGLGKAISGAMEAMGRQPEIQGKLQLSMIIGAAFIEALTIYALVTMFLMKGLIVVK
jgi:F-type H+-transporting ATPase subunit c